MILHSINNKIYCKFKNCLIYFLMKVLTLFRHIFVDFCMKDVDPDPGSLQLWESGFDPHNWFRSMDMDGETFNKNSLVLKIRKSLHVSEQKWRRGGGGLLIAFSSCLWVIPPPLYIRYHQWCRIESDWIRTNSKYNLFRIYHDITIPLSRAPSCSQPEVYERALA